MVTVYPETTAEDTIGITIGRAAPLSSRCITNKVLIAGLYSSGNTLQVAGDKSRNFASSGHN